MGRSTRSSSAWVAEIGGCSRKRRLRDACQRKALADLEADAPASTGDRVVALSNRRDLGLLNGARGTVARTPRSPRR